MLSSTQLNVDAEKKKKLGVNGNRKERKLFINSPFCIGGYYFFKKYILFREWCIKDKFINKIVLWESQKIFVAKIIKQILNKKRH